MTVSATGMAAGDNLNSAKGADCLYPGSGLFRHGQDPVDSAIGAAATVWEDITPLGERYLGVPEDVPGNSKAEMMVLGFGPLPGNSPEEGILLFTNDDRGANDRGGATHETEALL